MFLQGNFTWLYTVIQPCNCTQGIPLIDTYVCLDPSGFPVADEYCNNYNNNNNNNNQTIIKPPRDNMSRM
eukprot:UN10425